MFWWKIATLLNNYINPYSKTKLNQKIEKESLAVGEWEDKLSRKKQRNKKKYRPNQKVNKFYQTWFSHLLDYSHEIRNSSISSVLCLLCHSARPARPEPAEGSLPAVSLSNGPKGFSHGEIIATYSLNKPARSLFLQPVTTFCQ
jgi:hypothetical protein